jgi:hypothetical protein
MENLELNTAAEGLSTDVENMNFFQRIIGIVVSPSKTMEYLIAKPKILFAILSTALGTLGLYAIRFPLYKDFLKQAMEISMANSSTKLTPDQIQQAIPMASIVGLVSTPITSLITWIIGAAVLFGLIKIFKGQGSFLQVASITGYAYVISLIYLIISLIVSFFTGSILFNSSLTNITNLFVPDLQGSFLYGVIRGIDLFTIWHYAVIGIGITLLSKIDKVKVWSIISIIYIATILIGANSLKIM